MNPQQPIWILRNQKINGPHPLSKVVGAKKNGKILPTDQLGTSPSGPWHEWSGFVAEIKASSPPSHQPKDDQPASHQSQGVYRVNPSIIIINRKAAEFPYRCILSGKTAGLIKQTIHIQAPDSLALLTEGEKKMTPWKWIKRATGFAIDQIPGLSNVKDVVGKGGEFWNYFGLGKTVPVEVFVDKEAFTKWTQRNRRASRWLLYSVGVTVCAAGISALIETFKGPLTLFMVFFGIGLLVGLFGIPACIAMRLVMGNRRLLEMNCFNDDWLWLHCREKAFVESLKPSPLPAPVYKWFFGKSELPSGDSTG